ncbi:unnamed protein product, partial [Ixodes persulcatus]
RKDFSFSSVRSNRSLDGGHGDRQVYWGIRLDQDLLETIVSIYPEWFRDYQLNLMAEQTPRDRTTPSPPSVDEASLHQAMDRNKESLKVKLMLRRPITQLVEQGIMPSLKASPAFHEQRKNLERAKMGDYLKNKIQRRPDRQELIQQHILEDTTVDPSLQDKQRQLKKARLADGLNDRLSHRPGPLELVKGNILQTDASFAQAIKEGQIPFRRTCEGESRRHPPPSHFLIDEDSAGSDSLVPSPGRESNEQSQSSLPSMDLSESSSSSTLHEGSPGSASGASPRSSPPVAPAPPPAPLGGSALAAASLASLCASHQQQQQVVATTTAALVQPTLQPLLSAATAMTAAPTATVFLAGATATVAPPSTTAAQPQAGGGKAARKKSKSKAQPKTRTIKFHEYKVSVSAVSLPLLSEGGRVFLPRARARRYRDGPEMLKAPVAPLRRWPCHRLDGPRSPGLHSPPPPGRKGPPSLKLASALVRGPQCAWHDLPPSPVPKASKKDTLPGSFVEPEKEDSAGTSFASHSGAPGVNASSADVSDASKDRIDTVYYSVEDVINSFFGLMPCPECGAKTVTVSKAPGKEYGLCANLVLACSICDLREEQFSSPRMTGDAKITPFEVNVRAMKAIQSIGKGATALSDFFATMNISHRGLRHKTYQGHMDMMVQACNATATECEAASLRYTTMLSDGDSRTFHALTEDAVYGFVKVEKKDCIKHVHKRMGAALRGLVDKKKAQGEPLGGKGWLTQDKIKKITNYYGYALRSHKKDVPGMRSAVEATLQHMSSTDETPKHSLCPEGPESWCSYNRAMATNEEPPPHKNSLPDFVCEALEPVFARLSDEALLKRCSDGMTQNSNESLRAMIWNHLPPSAAQEPPTPTTPINGGDMGALLACTPPSFPTPPPSSEATTFGERTPPSLALSCDSETPPPSASLDFDFHLDIDDFEGMDLGMLAEGSKQPTRNSFPEPADLADPTLSMEIELSDWLDVMMPNASSSSSSAAPQNATGSATAAGTATNAAQHDPLLSTNAEVHDPFDLFPAGDPDFRTWDDFRTSWDSTDFIA